MGKGQMKKSEAEGNQLPQIRKSESSDSIDNDKDF